MVGLSLGAVSVVTPLTATASWPVSQWPDIAWGLTVVTGTARSAAAKSDKASA